MSRIEDLLQTELTPDLVPDNDLNASILKQAKEIQNMKRKPIKSSVAAAVAVGVFAVGSVSVAAAYHFLSPAQVADELTGSKTLAAAFESSDAVVVNETQTTAGYDVTLLGIVTGKDLIPTIADSEDSKGISLNKTYAVVAIENSDGSPMPDIKDAAYQTFCVSALIHGKSVMEVNNGTLHAGVSSFVQDGVQYELLECSDLEIFSGMGVSLGVLSTFGEETSAFTYSDATGLYSINPDFDGMNALFDLPLDTAKADEEAANAYFDNLKENGCDSAADEEADWTDNPKVEEWTACMSDAGNSTLDSWNYVREHAVLDETYTQVAMPDEEGYVRFATEDGDMNMYYVGDWSYDVGVEWMSGCQSGGTMEGSSAETFTLNEDGSFTLLIYRPAQ